MIISLKRLRRKKGGSGGKERETKSEWMTEIRIIWLNPLCHTLYYS